MAKKKYCKLAKRHVPSVKGPMSYIYSLNVPSEIAEKVPEGTVFEFKVENGKFVFTPLVIKKEVVAVPVNLDL